MTNAPTAVSEEQLKDLHIRVKLPVKAEAVATPKAEG
jgi:hypothetical protein